MVDAGALRAGGGGGGGLSHRLTSTALRARFCELVHDRADLRVADLILGERIFEWVQSVGVVAEPALGAMVPPFPPLELRQVVSDHQLEMFLWTGFLDAQCIADIIERHRGATPLRILDFGAGCGRVARFFMQADPPFQVVTADVNPDHVLWCRMHLATLEAAVHVGEMPPLPFRDSEFDCAYAISVMTHLDRERALAWKRELERVVKPGGLIVLTTHGEAVLDRIKESAVLQDWFRMSPARAEAIHAELPRAGHLFEVYAQDVLELARAGAAYGNSFTDAAFARTWWTSDQAAVVEHVPAGLRGWQDVIVLEKRGA